MTVETLKSLGKVVTNEKGGYRIAFFLAAHPDENNRSRESICYYNIDDEQHPVIQRVLEEGAATVTYERGSDTKSGFKVLQVSPAEEPLILH